MAKPPIKPEQFCKPTAHHFVVVEITPHAQQYAPNMGGLGQYVGSPSARTFRLFCCNCGQVRLL